MAGSLKTLGEPYPVIGVVGRLVLERRLSLTDEEARRARWRSSW
jgi:hypothetical protein